MKFKQYLTERKLYHGSYTPVKKLRTSQKKLPYSASKLMGIYLTSNPEQARTFGPIVNKIKLKSNKILDLTKYGEFDADKTFLDQIPVLKKEEKEEYLLKFYRGPDTPYGTLERLNYYFNIVNRLKKKYDGVAFRESHQGTKGIVYAIWNKNVLEIIE